MFRLSIASPRQIDRAAEAAAEEDGRGPGALRERQGRQLRGRGRRRRRQRREEQRWRRCCRREGRGRPLQDGPRRRRAEETRKSAGARLSRGPSPAEEGGGYGHFWPRVLFLSEGNLRCAVLLLTLSPSFSCPAMILVRSVDDSLNLRLL